MSIRTITVAVLLSISTLVAADPWALYFADAQDSSKVYVATFEVWDEDGTMHPRLPETYNRTQCLYVAELLSRSSKLAHLGDPDHGMYGCEPTDA